jgi:type II secretion system protein G
VETPSSQLLPTARASLWLGIASWFLGPLTGIPAIICGHIATRKIRKSPQKFRGSGLALTGLILGYSVSLLYTALLLFAFFAGSYTVGISENEGSARAHMNALKTALLVYRGATGDFPSTAQGLEALVKRPDGAAKWRQAMEKLYNDPWGRPYQYRYPSAQPKTYDVFSLGPDGKESADDVRP